MKKKIRDIEISKSDKIKEKFAIGFCLVTCLGLFLKIVFF